MTQEVDNQNTKKQMWTEFEHGCALIDDLCEEIKTSADSIRFWNEKHFLKDGTLNQH